MRRHLLLTMSAALPLACASAPRPGPARAEVRLVRLAEGAVLRTRADDGAPGVTVAAGATLRRVRARGAWVELETLGAPGRQCAPTLLAPRGMRLRFFARASSVGAVLAAPLSLSGPEGALAVQPGVAVSAGATLVHAGLRLTLPASPSTAQEHRAPEVDRPAPSGERLAPGTRAALPDGAAVEVARDPPVYVRARRATRDGARVVVVTPCVRFEAVVPEAAVLPVLDLEVDDRGDEPAGARWVVRADARLRWSDGSPAGRAAGAVRLADEGRAVGAARCFRVPLRVGGGPSGAAPLEAEVCADAGDVAAAR